MKNSKQIRQEFITFFEERGHRFVRSAPVVPNDDPTLLFSNSGMAQFKEVFLGTGVRNYNRAVNSQKCIRASGKHNDLEDVGHDNYHHTFFEMLGNWSFGDYFKKEAIEWAWELMTGVWSLPKDKLWATVFEGGDGMEADEEAETLWLTSTGINPDQVLRFDKKDNFWEMGEVGPCGPCSELHIDLGEGTCPLSYKHDCSVNLEDCWRFVELWNLVFIQYQRFPDGHLEPLAAKHVDTGMGLERISRVLQKVDSNYSTDLFTPILASISEVTDQTDSGGDVSVAYRVIADHLRSLSFAIADGATPSNEGRGYVLRRMLRRATRFGRVLNMDEPFIYKLVPILAEVMGDAFPEIQRQQKHVQNVIKAEETSFGLTLDRGLEIFEKMAAAAETISAKKLSGEDAFKLYDTYGFPLDLTQLLAKEKNIKVDVEGFKIEMDTQKDRARQSGKFIKNKDEVKWNVILDQANSLFEGYNKTESSSKILKYRKLSDHYEYILDKTPFYAESGGQIGDRGKIYNKHVELDITDTIKLNNEIIHISTDFDEKLIKNNKVICKIKISRRNKIKANHTATHLLHTALKEVLGNHVQQAGSLVSSDRLRFDLTHYSKISKDEISKIEGLVNNKIRENISLEVSIKTFEEAKNDGAVAMFNEKYGDEVRVVDVPGFSKELCGGTHVDSTGEISLFKIITESSLSTGVRRIDAITGESAFNYFSSLDNLVSDIKTRINCSQNEILDRIDSLIEGNKVKTKKIEKLTSNNQKYIIKNLISNSKYIYNDIRILISRQDDIINIKEFGDRIREQSSSNTIAVIGSILKNKPMIMCIVTNDLMDRISAREVIALLAPIIEGGGGGKDSIATAGGKKVENLDKALKESQNIIEGFLNEK